MLRNLLISILLLSFTTSSFSQSNDTTSSTWKNHIAVEGGGWKMHIDTITPLNGLIKRLYSNWEFIETGKMYWIGYTNDMFSIAARGDNAIQPLIHLLQNSTDRHARHGALYCLHLIGINSTITGRFSEEFVNPKARMALLQFLKDTTFQEEIMRLLIRDPWSSDIATIIATLKNSTTDSWALVNGLTRYRISKLPIHQTIPDTINNITVNLKYTNPMVLENNFDFNGQIREALDSFRNLKNEKINIEDTLFKSLLTGDIGSKYGSPVSIEDFFRLLDFDYYTCLGSRVHYYVTGEQLFICSPETAKQRILQWWAGLSAEEQAAYNKNQRLTR